MRRYLGTLALGWLALGSTLLALGGCTVAAKVATGDGGACAGVLPAEPGAISS